MVDNDIYIEKTKKVNEATRYFFDNNKYWIVESVCPEYDGDKSALAVMLNNETYLLYKANKIYWKGDFFDMDERTKKFTEKLYCDFQHAQQSKLYNIWFGAKQWIIVALIWILGAGACICIEIMQRRMEQETDKKQQATHTEKKASLSIDFLKAKQQMQKHCNDALLNKNL
ncbi:MAG: hypothetical protein K5912_04435 [Alphaproteobacteria bacterium]|nr:hypothetical protein [Alphaproteobacteria bacterium]